MLFDLIKIFTCGPEFFIANFAIKREPLNVNFDMSPDFLVFQPKLVISWVAVKY